MFKRCHHLEANVDRFQAEKTVYRKTTGSFNRVISDRMAKKDYDEKRSDPGSCVVIGSDGQHGRSGGV